MEPGKSRALQFLTQAVRIDLNKVKWSRDVQGCVGMTSTVQGWWPSPSPYILNAPAALTSWCQSKPPRLLQKPASSTQTFFFISSYVTSLSQKCGASSLEPGKYSLKALWCYPVQGMQVYTLWTQAEMQRPTSQSLITLDFFPLLSSVDFLPRKIFPAQWHIRTESYSHLWSFCLRGTGFSAAAELPMIIPLTWTKLNIRAAKTSMFQFLLFSHSLILFITDARSTHIHIYTHTTWMLESIKMNSRKLISFRSSTSSIW